MENGDGNSELSDLSHYKCWCSIVILVYHSLPKGNMACYGDVFPNPTIPVTSSPSLSRTLKISTIAGNAPFTSTLWKGSHLESGDVHRNRISKQVEKDGKGKALSGRWMLVAYPSEKYEFVSCNDYSQDIWKTKIHVHSCSSHHRPLLCNLQWKNNLVGRPQPYSWAAAVPIPSPVPRFPRHFPPGRPEGRGKIRTVHRSRLGIRNITSI